MRLIDVKSFALSEFFGSNIPHYAILSHTWGAEEVTFQDWQNLKRASRMQGFEKIRDACLQARRDGYRWLWVDTNCIDKTSSSELTEAINSMYRWYADAGICYAYLADYSPRATSRSKFSDSRWFTRGWTLQELVAPKEVVFYGADWHFIGRKSDTLLEAISSVTGIPTVVFRNPKLIGVQSIAERMSWLAGRKTTREEDMAYCTLGLFDINMPLLYGEGMKAFTRLQEEIIKVSTDHTIFCWHWTAHTPKDWVSLLAPSPQAFSYGSRYQSSQQRRSLRAEQHDRLFEYAPIYSMTNAGLSIRLPVVKTAEGFMICLNVPRVNFNRELDVEYAFIPVAGYPMGDTLNVWRISFPREPTFLSILPFNSLSAKPLLAFARPDAALRSEGIRGGLNLPSDHVLGKHGLYVLTDLRQDDISSSDVSAELPMVRFDWDPRFNSETNLVDLDWTHRPRSGVSGTAATLMRIPDKSANRYIFLAAKEENEETQWFCQAFAVREHLSVNEAIEDLIHQVKRARRGQEAHYSKSANVSVVIGNRIHAPEIFKELRVLNVSIGRTKYQGLQSVPTNEMEKDLEGSPKEVQDEDEESDVGSTIVQVPRRKMANRLAPLVGQFVIRGAEVD